jgi:hypothetical protein
VDLYLEFDDSGQLSTKIYDKRDNFNFKIINFPNMCSNIPASPAYGVYISKNTFTSHIDKKIYFWHFSWLLYLYTFSLYENASLIIVSYQLLLHMVFTSRNWFAMQEPVSIILISWNVIFIWRQTSRSHYGSKVPAVTITVLKYRNKIGKIVVKAVPYSVK